MTASVVTSNLSMTGSFRFSEEALKEARVQMQRSPLPDQNEEPWRKIDLRGLPMPDFLDSATAALQGTSAASRIEIKIPQGSGTETAFWTGPSLQKEGLAQISLKELSQIEARFEKSARPYDYFDHCNRAFASQILFIKINGKVDGPLRIRHHLLSGQSLVHRIYILAEALSEATIIEEFTENNARENGEAKNDPRLYLPATLLYCQAGAQVEHITKNNLSKHTWHFLRNRYVQERDSFLRSAWLHTGAKSGKDLIVADIRDTGARFRGLGAKLADGKEFSDVDAAVCHHAGHSQSSLLYKMVLSGRAHSVFTGNLFIEPGTKGIDSHQENHNILLSDTARAESMPDLVIRAEEVSCEHGATVGALDETALFFLMARGLPEAEARELLIEAFLSALLEELSFGAPASKPYSSDNASSRFDFGDTDEVDSEPISPAKTERQRLLAEFRKKLAFGKKEN